MGFILCMKILWRNVTRYPSEHFQFSPRDLTRRKAVETFSAFRFAARVMRAALAEHRVFFSAFVQLMRQGIFSCHLTLAMLLYVLVCRPWAWHDIAVMC